MSSFADRIKSSVERKVVLYRARDDYGRDFYAYIRCDRKGLFEMKRDYETRTARKLADYGEVLYTAFGREPDAAAKAFLESL